MRWSNLLTDASADQATLPGYREPAVVRHFDAPEALDIRFYEVRAKSALNRVPERSQMPFRWTVNPYRGCSHACAYCFARPTHKFLDMSPGRDFEREIVVKVNAPEVLRAELSRPAWSREHVAMGTNTDPYQWVEGRYKLMRGIWEALRDTRTPCSVLTKSPLVLRDLDLLLEIAEVTQVSANLSIPTLDEQAWRATEPHTPSPRARLEAVRKLNEAGIPTGVLVAPLMPGINDAPEQVAAVLDGAAEAGATSVGGIALHLRGETRDVWFDWLRAQRPDLVPRYERMYARSAYAPAAERERLATLLREGKAARPGLRSFSRRNLDAARPQVLDSEDEHARRMVGGPGATAGTGAAGAADAAGGARAAGGRAAGGRAAGGRAAGGRAGASPPAGGSATLQLTVGAQRRQDDAEAARAAAQAAGGPDGGRRATSGGRPLPPAAERAPVPCEPHLLDRDPAPPPRPSPGRRVPPVTRSPTDVAPPHGGAGRPRPGERAGRGTGAAGEGTKAVAAAAPAVQEALF